MIKQIGSNALAAVANQNGPKLFVLDTNVLLHDPTCLLKFKENHIYIPFVTIEELDNKKVGNQDINRNARHAIRLIEDIMSYPSVHEECQAYAISKAGYQDVAGNLYIQKEYLPFLENDHVHKNDNMYLAVLKYLQEQTSKKPRGKFVSCIGEEPSIIMVTKDLNLRIKARALGFFAEDYKHDHVVDDADMVYAGILDVEDSFLAVDGVQTSKKQNATVYTLPNQGWYPNQFLRTPQEKIYQVTNISEDGFVTIYPVKNYKKTKTYGISARNEEQQAALSLLLDKDIDFVALLGPAGTGKTLLTLASALEQVKAGLFDEIIFTRATIPVGEEIGFLPGDEKEKMTPWAGAIFDNLDVLSEINTEDAGTDTHRIIKQNELHSKVSIKAMTFMRGRTFNNKFLIVDEAQNLTPKQVKTLITRCGDGTKIVLMGNLAQIDTPYISEASAGLTYAVERFKGWAHFGSVILSKGERSRLANEGNDRL